MRVRDGVFYWLGGRTAYVTSVFVCLALLRAAYSVELVLATSKEEQIGSDILNIQNTPFVTRNTRRGTRKRGDVFNHAHYRGG